MQLVESGSSSSERVDTLLDRRCFRVPIVNDATPVDSVFYGSSSSVKATAGNLFPLLRAKRSTPAVASVTDHLSVTGSAATRQSSEDRRTLHRSSSATLPPTLRVTAETPGSRRFPVPARLQRPRSGAR